MRKAAKEMMDKSDEDCSHLQGQLIELTTKWEKVCKLTVNKKDRLEDALTEVRGPHTEKCAGHLSFVSHWQRVMKRISSMVKM